MVGCTHQEPINQAVPKNLRLSGIPREAPRITRAPPVASCETHPKISDSKIFYRLIKVLGLPVPFMTSA
jgi:hypothetical protein